MFPSFAAQEYVSAMKQKHILLLETMLPVWQNRETLDKHMSAANVSATCFLQGIGSLVFSLSDVTSMLIVLIRSRKIRRTNKQHPFTAFAVFTSLSYLLRVRFTLHVLLFVRDYKQLKGEGFFFLILIASMSLNSRGSIHQGHDEHDRSLMSLSALIFTQLWPIHQ